MCCVVSAFTSGACHECFLLVKDRSPTEALARVGWLCTLVACIFTIIAIVIGAPWATFVASVLFLAAVIFSFPFWGIRVFGRTEKVVVISRAIVKFLSADFDVNEDGDAFVLL